MPLEKRTVARSPLLQQILAQGAIAPPQNFKGMHPLAAAMHGISQGLERRALRKAEAEKQKLADQAGSELSRALQQTQLPAMPSQDEFSYGNEPHVVGGKPSDIAAALMNPDLTAQQAQVGGNIMQSRQAAQQAAADDKRRFARETMLQDARIAADERIQRERAASEKAVAGIRASSNESTAGNVQMLRWFEETYGRKPTIEETMQLLGRTRPMTSAGETALLKAQEKLEAGELALTEMTSMAADFEAQIGKMPSGQAAVLSEWFKGVAGLEDTQISALRTKFRRLRNSEVVKNLPPGVASDKDIEIAMAGWPKDTSNPEYVAAYLRGMAKLRVIELARMRHKAEYIGATTNSIGLNQDWQANKEMLIMSEFALHGIELTGGGDSSSTADTDRQTRLQQIRDKQKQRKQPPVADVR